MKQKRMRLVVVVIVIIAIIAVIVKVTNSPKKEEEKKSYADMQENGTIVNTSQKLAETKKYNGLEITNIKLTTTESVTSLKAEVKNASSNETKAQVVDINVLDKEGNIMVSFPGTINALKPGEITAIDSSVTANCADNAYNIEFVAPKEKEEEKGKEK